MIKAWKCALVVASSLALLIGPGVAAPSPGNSPRSGQSDRSRKINHVFVIVLENEGFDVTFGPNSPAPFL